MYNNYNKSYHEVIPMKKNWFKLLLDLAMAVFIVLLFNKNATGMAFHEIAGLALFAAFALHLILNAGWIGGITKKIFAKNSSLTARSRLMYIIDFLLVISWAVVAVTGIMISKVVFSFHIEGMAKSIHSCAAAVGLLLFGIHLGLHRQFIGGMFSKLVKLPQKVSVIIGTVLTIIILVFGCYSLTSTQYVSWLKGPFVSSSEQHGSMGNKGNFQFKASGNASGQQPSQSGMGQMGHGGEGQGGGSFVSVIKTIAQFFSIACIFAFITSLIDKLIHRKKKT